MAGKELHKELYVTDQADFGAQQSKWGLVVGVVCGTRGGMWQEGWDLIVRDAEEGSSRTGVHLTQARALDDVLASGSTMKNEAGLVYFVQTHT